MTEHGGHIIYDKSEADEKGISYKHWKEKGVKKGDWILTDDERVLEALNVYNLWDRQGKKSVIIRLCIGQFSQRSNKKLYTNGETARMGVNTYMKSKMTSREQRLVDLILGGVEPVRAASLIYPTNKNPVDIIRHVMKKEGVVKYMQSKLLEAFGAIGVDEAWFAKRLMTEATSEKNYGNVRLEALKTIARLCGYEPGTVKAKEEEAITFGGEGNAIKKLERKREVLANGGMATGSNQEPGAVEGSGQSDLRRHSEETVQQLSE